MERKQERLFSLDLLRGIDMFLLTGGIAGVVVFFGKRVGLGEWCAYHIGHHCPWAGFSFWDIIMPLFIFMCGASVPLALEKRLAQGKGVFWKHVFSRVALLWICGMCAAGGLGTYDILRMNPYNNTLESIAAGYLIAAFVISFKRRWLVPTVAVALSVVYALLLHFGGDYGRTTNFAYLCDAKIIKALYLSGSEVLKGSPVGSGVALNYGYTWYLTSLMFGAMTLCGVTCTYVLTGTRTPWRKAGVMAFLGVGLLVVGFGLQPWIPRIKTIFTVTFTAQAMGYSALAWAALYVLTDIWRFRRGLGFLILFGQNALFAYMITHFFWRFPDVIAESFYDGLKHFFTPESWKTYLPLVKSVFHMATMIVLLHYWSLVKAGKRALAQQQRESEAKTK